MLKSLNSLLTLPFYLFLSVYFSILGVCWYIFLSLLMSLSLSPSLSLSVSASLSFSPSRFLSLPLSLSPAISLSFPLYLSLSLLSVFSAPTCSRSPPCDADCAGVFTHKAQTVRDRCMAACSNKPSMWRSNIAQTVDRCLANKEFLYLNPDVDILRFKVAGGPIQYFPCLAGSPLSCFFPCWRENPN